MAKMVPRPPPSQGDDSQGERSLSVDHEQVGEEGEACSSQGPFIEYRRLAIEVATRIAPDLQETPENTVQASLIRLQTEVYSHAGRLDELEQCVSHLEDENLTLLVIFQASAVDCARISEKLKDLENRSRQNNLRLIGLPESVPANELQVICEVDLPATLNVNGRCRVERAQHIGPTAPICHSANVHPWSDLPSLLPIQGNETGLPAIPTTFQHSTGATSETLGGLGGLQKVGTEVVKLGLFANYVILFMSNPRSDLVRIFKEISLFGLFSGYKINAAKSEALQIGSSLGALSNLSGAVKVKIASDHITYLGIKI